MSLDDFEEIFTPCNSVIVPKSPLNSKKKRSSHSQVKRSNAFKEKTTGSKKKDSSEVVDAKKPFKVTMKSKCFEEFESSFSSESSKLFYEKLSITKEDIFPGCVNPSIFKRSFSLPTIFTQHCSDCISIRSYSLPNSISHISNTPLSTTSLNLNPAIMANGISNPQIDSVTSSHLQTNSCPTEELISGASASKRSSTSTVRKRNDSVDSTFSQISISDIKEIEDSMSKEMENIYHGSGWRTRHSRSKSDASCDLGRADSVDEVFSLPNSFSEKRRPQRKSIFEGKKMVAPTECFFPRPQQGQSIASFLSSSEFNISAELDRENAHFHISEALIAALEHMKCTRTMKIVEEEEESDEEIRKLTQRIRIRRRERQREKTIRKTTKSIVLLSDGKTDTTSQSATPPISSHSSDFEVDSIGSEDEVEDFELSARTDSNLSSIKENGLSLSMASLYSDADLQKAQLRFKDSNKSFQDTDPNDLSAESVALSLIRRFSEKHLPKASELQWLVSEQEVQQKLLPLPNSWPISPDTIEEEYLEKTRLRGNFEWAPPRPQIIFSILPNMKRKDILEKQKYRCAGCGMKIEKNYVSRFRYCSYFGKYFCQCCHSNSLSYIPGRILWKWDFSKYYVSKFAFELLDKMYSDPLFNIEDVNNKLYQKVRQLDQCCGYRRQLFYLKDFMKTCRKAEGIKDLLEKQNRYMTHEPHMYSLSDLVQVKNGDLVKHLRYLIHPCLEHIKQCILCQAKAFICEICGKDKDLIFPFQLDRVIVCQVCGSCFHKCCFKNIKCPRCKRIEERKKRIKEEKSASEIFI